MTDATTPRQTRLRTGSLSPRRPTRFAFHPGDEERAALAQELGLLALRRLEFTGEIVPKGRDEMVLTATLAADADQPCSVTLAPVRARVAEGVTRRFVVGLDTPAGEEVEMPEDDTVEPLPEVIDLAAIAAEALMLALPLYPRAAGAELGTVTQAPKGAAPVEAVNPKPFAGLEKLAAALKARAGDDPDVSG